LSSCVWNKEYYSTTVNQNQQCFILACASRGVKTPPSTGLKVEFTYCNIGGQCGEATSKCKRGIRTHDKETKPTEKAQDGLVPRSVDHPVDFTLKSARRRKIDLAVDQPTDE